MGLFVQTTRGTLLDGAEPNGENRVSQEKPRIAVVTSAFQSKVGEKTLANLLAVLEPLARDIFVVTGMFSGKWGDNVHVTRITNHSLHDPLLVKAFKHRVLTQLKISYHLWRVSGKVERVLFFTGMLQYWMPMLAVKLRRKKAILLVTGSAAKNVQGEFDQRGVRRVAGVLLSRLFRLLEMFNCSLADRIVVESPSVVPFLGLERFRRKISGHGALPVDLESLKVVKPYLERGNLVGYVGRLIPGKGVMNLVQAIPLVLKEKGDVHFFVGGDGPLREVIGRTVEASGAKDRVELAGWVPEGRLASCLSDLKLLVFPSAAEGLPIIVLEAMACGTPVLAAPVGGVPDIITDGETGFILADTTPQGIARGVLQALNFPGLEEVARKARRLVEERYSQQGASRRFGEILLLP